MSCTCAPPHAHLPSLSDGWLLRSKVCNERSATRVARSIAVRASNAAALACVESLAIRRWASWAWPRTTAITLRNSWIALWCRDCEGWRPSGDEWDDDCMGCPYANNDRIFDPALRTACASVLSRAQDTQHAASAAVTSSSS